jgi:predicted 3-demethylubiquinone-9 3-methyltransferase (glyoxalase superfamily)
MKSKNTICLYAATFPNSEVTDFHKAPADYPSGKAAMS